MIKRFCVALIIFPGMITKAFHNPSPLDSRIFHEKKQDTFFDRHGILLRNRLKRTMSLNSSEEKDSSSTVFWKMQKDLAASMSESVDKSIKLYVPLSEQKNYFSNTYNSD